MQKRLCVKASVCLRASQVSVRKGARVSDRLCVKASVCKSVCVQLCLCVNATFCVYKHLCVHVSVCQAFACQSLSV